METEDPGDLTEDGKFLKRRTMIIISSIAGALLLFTLLAIIFPETFYDKFLYKYYLKSYIEDGEYNIVDTTTYGLMIAAAIFGIYRMLVKLDIEVDRRALYVILPWVCMGGTYRALEDSEYFRKPVIYFFRSPMIYFTIALTVILILLYSTWVQLYSRRKGWKNGFYLSVAMLGFFDILYIIYYFSTDRGISYQFNPLYPVILSVILGYLLYVDSRRRGYADMKTNILSTGLYFLFLSILPIAVWPRISSWKEHYLSLPARSTPELAWDIFLIIFAVTILTTLALVGIMYLAKRKNSKLGVFTRPMAFLIIFGHFLDASATSIGIDIGPYSEKHVLPKFMINLTGTPYVMFLLKLPLVLLVIFALDIWYKEDFQENKNLLNLVKMGIIILGLAPGLRDALRMAMGV